MIMGGENGSAGQLKSWMSNDDKMSQVSFKCALSSQVIMKPVMLASLL